MTEAFLRQSYISPGEKVAFSGINSIKKEFPHLTRTQISDVLASIHTYTLHREVKKVKVFNPFFIYTLRQQIQIDLIDVSKLHMSNDGVHFLFVAIDCFSKKTWLIQQNNKQGSTTLESFKTLLRIMRGSPPVSVFFDRGKEFCNARVYAYLAEHGINVFHPNSEIKAPIVERVNRTIQDIIFKYLTQYETLRYIDVMTELLRSYNERFHRTIKMSPNNAELPENHIEVRSNLNVYYDKARSKRTKRVRFKVGDTVRLAFSKYAFQRGFNERFKRELFKVVSIFTRMPITQYGLKSMNNNEVIQGKFYANELQKHTSKEFRIEEVLQSKTLKNGTRKHYVKWQDFDSTHNSWIDDSDLTDVFRR